MPRTRESDGWAFELGNQPVSKKDVPRDSILEECLTELQRSSKAAEHLRGLESRWRQLKDDRDTLETTVNVLISGHVCSIFLDGAAQRLWSQVGQSLDVGPFVDPKSGTYLGRTVSQLYETLLVELEKNHHPCRDQWNKEDVDVSFREDAVEMTLLQDPTVRWVIYYSDLCWPGINARLYRQVERDGVRIRGKSFMLAQHLIAETIRCLCSSLSEIGSHGNPVR